MKKILLVLVVSVFMAACSGAGVIGGSGDKLDIKIDGKNLTLAQKSGGSGYSNVISTAPGKPNIQTSYHTIIVANYELDTTSLNTMRQPLTAADQIQVLIGVAGEDGTNEKSPFKVGTYDAKGDKINELRALIVTTKVDGLEKDINFDTMSSVSKIAGAVKITSVTADSVSGEIDVTEGDKSVKGNFTAKLPVKK